MKILREKDVHPDCLADKKVAVIGYGSQGRAQALCLRDSSIDVIIGARPEGKSFKAASEDDFSVMPIPEAAAAGNIVHILIPDEEQVSVIESEILPVWNSEKTMSFSHGFSVHFGGLELPENTDIILVAPKGPGTEVRKAFVSGFGVPGLIACAQNFSGKAMETALALAHCMGLTRAGVLETTFRDETCEDLFGEQAVLCGGLYSLMKAGFEVLTEAGYPEEMAYFETVHEMKLIVDLIYEGGIGKMADVISNTAEWGMYSAGPEIVTHDIKDRMRNVLNSVENGEFAGRWLSEYRAGARKLKKHREILKNHAIEKTGKNIRTLFAVQS